MSDTPYSKVAADLIKSSMELIEQILLKHANAVLEEMHDQIVKRNTRISELTEALTRIAYIGDGTAPDEMRKIARAAIAKATQS